MVVNLEVSYQGDTRTVPVDNSCSLFDLCEAISYAFGAPLTLTVLVDKHPINSDAELLLVLARDPVPPLSAVATAEEAHPPSYDEGLDELAERLTSLQNNSSASPQELLSPETQRVVDTLVTLVYADPNAMRSAMDAMHELSQRTKTPIDNIFNAFNKALIARAATVPSSADTPVLVPSQTAESKDKEDVFVDALEPDAQLPPSYTIAVHAPPSPKPQPAASKEKRAASPSVAVLEPEPSPPVLTTAQLQALARQRRPSASPSGSTAAAALSRKFTAARASFSPPQNSARFSQPLASPSSSSSFSTSGDSAGGITAGLRILLDHATQAHKEVHEVILNEHPWLRSLHEKGESVAARVFGNSGSPTQDPRRREVVERIMKMPVASGVPRRRIEELVDEFRGDVDLVVDAVVSERMHS
ncbi:hypothetical protein HDU84_006064 [Entophlyctis sp. JEL0112]|nr:hypothetical protein HDU84_006064 [Entophlyctis sp. JEL0112]